MYAMEITHKIAEMLGTPGTDEYEAARIVLNERPTLWDAICATGVTDDMDGLAKAEMYWVCANMPEHISDNLLQRIRIALNSGIPVSVSWSDGDWDLAIMTGAGLDAWVCTPIPDLSRLESGIWFGSMASV